MLARPESPQAAIPGPTTASLSVRAGDDSDWLRFVEAHEDATLFHHPAWSRVLADSYAHRPVSLVQTDADGQITAGLPAMEIRRGLARPALVSLPFTDHCQPLARSPADLAILTTNLAGWRQSQHVPSISIHGALPAAPGVHLVIRGVRHILPLRPSSGSVLDGIRGGPVHRAIRKAQREGVDARLSQSPADLLLFYRLHLQTRRRLGVPIQPRRFFHALWQLVVESGLGFVVFASRAGQPIAAALFLAWNRNLIYKFGASDSRYWDLRPNNLVFWTAIEWACQHGYRLLDFGRTDLDNQGLRDFKSRWGSIEVPLVYSYVAPAPPRPMPDAPMRALATVIRSSPPIVCRALGELLYRRVPANVG